LVAFSFLLVRDYGSWKRFQDFGSWKRFAARKQKTVGEVRHLRKVRRAMWIIENEMFFVFSR